MLILVSSTVSQKRITGLLKMWSLKSVTVKLVYMQYNISDNQALFWCFVLIILIMASLDACSYILWDSKPGFALSLFLIFFAKIKAFVLIKLFL